MFIVAKDFQIDYSSGSLREKSFSDVSFFSLKIAVWAKRGKANPAGNQDF